MARISAGWTYVEWDFFIHLSEYYTSLKLATLSLTPYIASKDKKINEVQIGKDVEGGRRGLIEVLSQHLPEETEGNYETPQSRWKVSRQKCDPSPSQIQV
jgi:hypothetical protein